MNTELRLCTSDGAGGDSGGEANVYRGPRSGVHKYALADAEVARESDFGENEETHRCISHISNLLQVGDVVPSNDCCYEWRSRMVDGTQMPYRKFCYARCGFVEERSRELTRDEGGAENVLGRAKSGRAKNGEKMNKRGKRRPANSKKRLDEWNFWTKA